VVISQATTKWTATAYTFAEIAPGSVWVGIPLPDLVDVLPTIGADPGYVPHITLVYADFGEQTVDETALAQIVARIADCVQWEPALSGEIVGYGRFYGQEPDGDPIFAIPSIPRLDDVRARIVAALSGWDGVVSVNQVSGFVPHITLGYIPTGSAMPEIGIPETPVTATAVSVVYAGREATIAFGTADYWAGPVVVEASDAGHARVFEEVRFADVPEWIPGLPIPAIYQHPTYGEIDMTAAARDEIIANFNNKVYQSDVPIDVDHDIGSSGAAGYIREMRVNDDGSTDFRAEWTDIGTRMIEADRVKYVSPSYLPEWTDYSTDPLNPTVHTNVLIGHALCVRPFYKEAALRPLIAASEMAAENRRKGIGMATEKPGENEGAQIVAQQFGEKIADLERKFTDSEAARVAAETARTAAETRIASLESAAQERTFREQLAGLPTDKQDSVIKLLKHLPAEMYAETIALAMEPVGLRKALVGRGEIGSDGIKPAGDALTTLNAKAEALRESKPELTQAQAFTEVANANPDLKRKHYAEQAQA
jgi:hypothetical protein